MEIKRVKIIKIALALIIIFAVVHFGIIPFMFGGKNMESFCSQIMPGMSSSEIIRIAKEENYKAIEGKRDGKHTILVIDSRAMGRYICEISLNKDAAVAARYVYND